MLLCLKKKSNELLCVKEVTIINNLLPVCMYVHVPTYSCYDENILIASAKFTGTLYKEYTLAKEIKNLHPREFINSILGGFILAQLSIT